MQEIHGIYAILLWFISHLSQRGYEYFIFDFLHRTSIVSFKTFAVIRTQYWSDKQFVYKVQTFLMCRKRHEYRHLREISLFCTTHGSRLNSSTLDTMTHKIHFTNSKSLDLSGPTPQLIYRTIKISSVHYRSYLLWHTSIELHKLLVWNERRRGTRVLESFWSVL